MTDKMRDEFEAWARDSGEWDGEEDPFDWICYVTPDGTYYSDSLELAWREWKAKHTSSDQVNHASVEWLDSPITQREISGK